VRKAMGETGGAKAHYSGGAPGRCSPLGGIPHDASGRMVRGENDQGELDMRSLAWIYRFSVLAALVMAAGAGWKWG
jgi:hypothetical protein